MEEFTDIINPFDYSVIERCENYSKGKVNDLIKISLKAYEKYSKVSPSDRALMLRRFADLVDKHRLELAQLETLNVGKPISDSLEEISSVAEVFYYYSGAVDKHFGTTVPVSSGLDLTIYEPFGVVAAIVPWNFPALIASWKLAPALACGNTVILKPAEWTPLTALKLQDLALQAGFEKGVFQVATGVGNVTGAALAENEYVSKISFTGSTAVGKSIMKSATDNLKRVSLELGGKSASIVFPDADLMKATSAQPMSVFANCGQDCCARSRMLIEESVYDQVKELLINSTKSIVLGDPADKETQVGPLVSSVHKSRVSSFIDNLDKEVEIIYESEVPAGKGAYFPIILLETQSEDVAVVQEEIFGPVLTLLKFKDELDAIRLANATVYGLSGSIWTKDISKALRVAQGLKSGTLSVNSNSSVRTSTPFGGYKQSGIGSELGMEAMQTFSQKKNIFISTVD
jgi:acyl-CoA reductase-like NAD-dependent aldehyde dehydrogenase